MNKNPCVITTYAWYRPTGAARRLRRTVLALASAGIQVEYIGVKTPEFNSDKINIHPIKIPRLFASPDPSKKSLGFWFWYALISSIKCCVLAIKNPHCRLMGFTFSSAFTLLPARILTRKSFIVFIRSDEFLENSIKQVPLLLRIIFRVLVSMLGKTATKFVAVHEQLKGTMSKNLGEKIREKISVLPNDLPKITPEKEKRRQEILQITGKSEPAFFAALTARFERRKNAELLIDAWKEIPEPACLLLIGGGPYVQILQNKVKEYNLQNRIFFVDWRDDAGLLISGADLYIQPSLAEGMSNSLLEALAVGLPCIVSDIPVHRDVINEPELRFETSDTQKVTMLVTKFMLDIPFKEKMTKLCAEIANRYRFDWDNAVVKEIMN